ncbi:MAG: hypothetical protein EB145_08920, partial [Proteobacteria bacterium]|nr:hypothetical protein [Pseudomonadota bacterium]
MKIERLSSAPVADRQLAKIWIHERTGALWVTLPDRTSGIIGPSSGGGGGSSDHSLLSHLGWTSSGHDGTASRFAVFDGTGAAAYLAYPSSGITYWTGTAFGAVSVSAPLTFSGGTLAASVFTGDSGSGGSTGLVPAPAAGNGAAGFYLAADATWKPIPSGFVTFYPDPLEASDISGDKVARTTPSANAETTLTVAATGTGDNVLATFASASGVPGIALLPAGTSVFHVHVETGASNQIARLKFEILTCNSSGGALTVRTTGYSDNFSGSASTLEFGLQDTSGYTMATTDRVVYRISAARVSGPSTCNITVYFDGSSRTASIISTIAATTPATIGAEPAITAGTTSQSWQGTAVAVLYGGTGATSASAARTNLGLAIGTNVQAWDADLDALGALGNGLPYRSGGTWSANALGDLAISGASVQVTQARGLRETAGPTTLAMGAVAAGELLIRSGTSLIGAAIGSVVQAYSAILQAIAGLGVTGLIARTGVGTAAARTLTSGSSQITVTNGDGASGNPTISLSGSVAVAGVTALTLFCGMVGTAVTFDGSTAVSGFSGPSGRVYTASSAAFYDLAITVDTTGGDVTLSVKGNVFKCVSLTISGSGTCYIHFDGGSA